jgi:2-polyprenyl-6-methoxyphenol hydroxylase-like FAD-dependent oxidoreductase
MGLQNNKIAIVGGGPGGLTLARLLQLAGAQVNVYERDFDRDVRVQGATLDLHQESGLAALRAGNLLDEFKKNFRPGADKIVIVNEQGKIFYSEHEEEVGDKDDFGTPYFRPEIDRGPLRNILLDSLRPDTVTWDSQFISMEKQDNGWLLHFRNGRRVYADLVIGADGANSKVRPYVTGIEPFYSGVTALEGNVYQSEKTTPVIHQLLRSGKIFAFGNGQVLIVSSKGSGDLTFYVSWKADEKWALNNGLDYADKAQILTWFQSEFSGWDNVWHELFAQAELPFFPRPVYCMPLDQTWETSPNLTLIGDAAHLMPPFAGEGVNMAMLDALELGESLNSNQFNDLHEAICSYETRMRNRGAEAAQESLDNGEWMHGGKALAIMVEAFNKTNSF